MSVGQARVALADVGAKEGDEAARSMIAGDHDDRRQGNLAGVGNKGDSGRLLPGAFEAALAIIDCLVEHRECLQAPPRCAACAQRPSAPRGPLPYSAPGSPG